MYTKKVDKYDWKYIVLKDNGCNEKIEELRIMAVYEIYNYCEEICYKLMRGTYPKKHHKKGT